MVDWAARADALHATLADRFWSPLHRLHRLAPGRPLWPCGTWNYWWQAHAFGAALDRAERTEEPAARRHADVVLGGIARRGLGRLTNGFYDDMGWLALELLRVQPERRQDLERLLRAIQGGASTVCGGGVAWASGHRDFVNVPATGTAAVLALRWGATVGEDRLVDWGRDLVDWMHRTVVTPEGVVWDGVHARPDGGCEVERAEYTYTYGLVVAADLAAWRATGEQTYASRAARVADIALSRMTDVATGLWRVEGSGDGGLFRGILGRALSDLATATADADLAATVVRQAEAAWAAGRDGVPVAADWLHPDRGEATLSTHLSAVLLAEQAARLTAPR